MCGGMQVRRNPLLRADMKQIFHGQDGLSCHRTHQPAPAGLAIVAAIEAELIQSRAATSPIQAMKAAESASSAPPPQSLPIPTSALPESASSTTSSASTTHSLPIPISSSSSSSSSADEKAFIESDDKMENWINKKKKKNRFSDYSRNKNNNYSRNNSESFCNGGGGAKKSLFSTSLSPPDYYIITCNFHNSFARPSPADFLGACFFCNRSLGPGKDIYMYRGDRAFCSADCRYKQIVADESLSYTIPIDQRHSRSSSSTNETIFASTTTITVLG